MGTEGLTLHEIIADVISPDGASLEPDAARAIVKWKFSAQMVARMNWLADRNSNGTMAPQEREELDNFLRVGSLINLIQAKARLSLRQLEDE